MTIEQKTKNHEVQYLGVITDSNLNWKAHVGQLPKKVSRGIGIKLSKLRHFVHCKILVQLYYSFIYPFMIHGLEEKVIFAVVK